MHHFQENQYKVKIVTNVIKQLFNIKQEENESVSAYKERFITTRDLLISHPGGEIRLWKYSKNLEDWDDSDANKKNKCFVG